MNDLSRLFLRSATERVRALLGLPRREENAVAARADRTDLFGTERSAPPPAREDAANLRALAGRPEPLPFPEVARPNEPSVFRNITPVEVLERRDARLRGKLSPPPGDALPEGISVRTDPNGVRVATFNIHMGIPGDILPLAVSGESLDALRDCARAVNSVDADVIVLQEVRNRPFVEGQEGLGDAVSVFAHLIKAKDMAFTPAISGDPLTGSLRHYGTAIYTRNGFQLDRVANVALPNSGPEVEARSAGIAAVSKPGSKVKPFTVLSTHLSDRVVEDQPLRDLQLGELARISQELKETGSFTYRDALGGQPHRAEGFPGGRQVLGGDLNQKQAPSDLVLEPGLTHVNTQLSQQDPALGRAADVFTAVDVPTNTPHRIDHLYASGMKVRAVGVGAALPREGSMRPTDHKLVVADFAE